MAKNHSNNHLFLKIAFIYFSILIANLWYCGEIYSRKISKKEEDKEEDEVYFVDKTEILNED